MILTTQREIQVWTYLKANRKRLRSVVEARCRNDGRLLAAVYPLRDEFWVWHLGERYSPEQWRVEVEIMTEDPVLEEEPPTRGDGDASRPSDALEEEPPATGDGNASRSPSDAPVDNSARNFPDAMFQIHDPVGAYKTHTLEQILTAYPAGAHSSCIKCRSTYVIDYLTISYVTGEYTVNRSQKRNIFYPARVSCCSDRNHDCDEHLTAERPWNIPWPARA
jgi:hypothetical protein